MKETQKYVFAEIHVDRGYLDRWQKVLRWKLRLDLYRYEGDISKEPRKLASKSVTIWEGPESIVPVWIETVCEYLREKLEDQIVAIKPKGEKE